MNLLLAALLLVAVHQATAASSAPRKVRVEGKQWINAETNLPTILSGPNVVSCARMTLFSRLEPHHCIVHTCICLSVV